MIEQKPKRKMKPGGIYLISCLSNSKVYVGSAKDLSTRYSKHTGMLASKKHFNRHLQNAWNLYGAKAFQYSIFKVLGEYSKEYYFSEENDVMEALRKDGVTLFNIAKAQGGWGEDTKLRTAEIIAKAKATRAASDAALTKEERKAKYGPWKNGTTNETHRINTSLGMLGIIRTEKNKANISNGLKRHPRLIAVGKSTGYKNLAKKGDIPKNAKGLFVNGIFFSSLFKAAESGMVTPKLIAYIQNPLKHPCPAKFKKEGLPNVVFA